MISPKDIDVFWAKVKKRETCWTWQGGRTAGGYGYFRNQGAHRIAFFLATGVKPEDKLVLHSCDNRACCNPSHLKLGTHKDNAVDMVQKQRHRPRQPGDKGRIQTTFTKDK